MNDGRALQLQSLIPHRRSAPLSGSEYYGCLMHVIHHHAPIERTTRYSIEGEGLQHVVVLDRQRVGLQDPYKHQRISSSPMLIITCSKDIFRHGHTVSCYQTRCYHIHNELLAKTHKIGLGFEQMFILFASTAVIIYIGKRTYCTMLM